MATEKQSGAGAPAIYRGLAHDISNTLKTYFHLPQYFARIASFADLALAKSRRGG